MQSTGLGECTPSPHASLTDRLRNEGVRLERLLPAPLLQGLVLHVSKRARNSQHTLQAVVVDPTTRGLSINITQTAHRHLNQPWPSHRGDGNGWLHARKGVSMVTGHTPLFVRAHRAETARGQRTCPQQHQPGTTPAVARSTQHRMQTQDKHVQTSLLGTPSDDACRHVRGAALHLAYHMLPHHSSHQTCRRQRARARG